MTKKIDTILIKLDQPTELTFSELHTWVIWQYPRPVGKGLCGAVRPPVPEHGWLPAEIRLKEKVVQVHGHIDQQFRSPEAAADWISETFKSNETK